MNNKKFFIGIMLGIIVIAIGFAVGITMIIDTGNNTDNVDVVSNNITLTDCPITKLDSVLIFGSARDYYLYTTKDDQEYEFKVSKDVYNSAQKIIVASIILREPDKARVDIMFNAINKYAYGVALSKNRK